jgi:hypothetical protein
MESVLSQPIDIERARAAGACTNGLEWARQNPGATVRQMMREAPTWAAWYLSRVQGVDDAELIRFLGSEARLSDSEILGALSPGWPTARVVRAFDAAWDDDKRVAGLLVGVWKDRYIPNALSTAWQDDARVVQALGYHLNDVRLVRLLENPWHDIRVAEALSRAWGNDDRVARAVVVAWHDNDESPDMNRIRRALRYAWDDARAFRALENLEPKGITNA